MAYEPRTYRLAVKPEGLVCFEVTVKETDLQVCAQSDLSDRAGDLAVQARWEIEEFTRAHPYFSESLTPVELPSDAPALVSRMADAARIANVGPMAAVAGAVAEHVARGLANESPEVIVENGGDLYLMGETDRIVQIWAGEEAAAGVGIRVPGGLMPVSVCTSSGRVGHSKSFGDADAVSVIARNGALADAVATGLANRIHMPEDIEAAIEAARGILGILGVVATIDGHLGAWGNVHLVPISEG